MTKTTSAIDNACQTLELMDARAGLGKRLFEAISSLTPSVSVELIVKSADQKYSLLTWRDDELYGPGWHVPGGVVRFKENLINRVEKVVHQEIGVPAKSIEGPIGFHEVFNKERDRRGHFICFVYRVILSEEPLKQRQAIDKPLSAGQWRWFSRCPENFIKNQRYLIGYINA